MTRCADRKIKVFAIFAFALAILLIGGVATWHLHQARADADTIINGGFHVQKDEIGTYLAADDWGHVIDADPTTPGFDMASATTTDNRFSLFWNAPIANTTVVPGQTVDVAFSLGNIWCFNEEGYFHGTVSWADKDGNPIPGSDTKSFSLNNNYYDKNIHSFNGYTEDIPDLEVPADAQPGEIRLVLQLAFIDEEHYDITLTGPKPATFPDLKTLHATHAAPWESEQGVGGPSPVNMTTMDASYWDNSLNNWEVLAYSDAHTTYAFEWGLLADINGYVPLNVIASGSGPQATLTADPIQINNGSTSALTWTSQNATECHSEEGKFDTGGSPNNEVGVIVGPLASTTIYRINCAGAEASAVVSVTKDKKVGVDGCYANMGGTCSSAAANSCGMTGTGNYECDGSCSASAPSDSLCTPGISIIATPGIVDSGSPVLVTWTSENAVGCLLTSTDGIHQEVRLNGNLTDPAVTQTVIYTLACFNQYTPGTVQASSKVEIKPKFIEH